MITCAGQTIACWPTNAQRSQSISTVVLLGHPGHAQPVWQPPPTFSSSSAVSSRSFIVVFRPFEEDSSVGSIASICNGRVSVVPTMLRNCEDYRLVQLRLSVASHDPQSTAAGDLRAHHKTRAFVNSQRIQRREYKKLLQPARFHARPRRAPRRGSANGMERLGVGMTAFKKENEARGLVFSVASRWNAVFVYRNAARTG
jgi:hypothetical protein